MFMFYFYVVCIVLIVSKRQYYFHNFYLKKKKKEISLRTATSPPRISKLPQHLFRLKLLNHIHLVLQLLVYSSLLHAGATETAACLPLKLHFPGTKLRGKEPVRNKTAVKMATKQLHRN